LVAGARIRITAGFGRDGERVEPVKPIGLIQWSPQRTFTSLSPRCVTG
jgi:hypothetical protein